MALEVKLENIDESDKYLYRARTLKIRISTSKTIRAPIRAITNTEMNAKATIPAEIPIEADIGFVNIKLSSGQRRNIKAFLKKNSVYNRIRDSIYYHLLRMQYFPLNVVLVQPTQPAISLLKTKHLKEKFLRMVVDLQIRDLGLNVVTIPWIELTPKELANIYRIYRNNLPDDIEVIPILDISEAESLERYLEALNPYLDQIQFIGVIYKKIATHKASYDVLWERLYDKDIAVLLIDVQREGASDIVPKVASPHYAEFIMGDITAEWVPFGGGAQKLPKRPVDTVIKFFDRSKLTIENLRDFKWNYDDWIDTIASSLNYEKTVIDALQNYPEAQRNPEKLSIIKAISKVHEFRESRDEFKRSQKYINQTDSIDYIKEKEALKKIFLGQKRL
ncbi:hypothetical protein CHITON_1413 [Thermococcus chitonophagus]|nr:hypothetical protein CHITON_1413 [Thermococcus chitonophagus]